MENDKYYSVSTYGHTDGPGRIKLDCSVSVNLDKADMQSLTSIPIAELEQMKKDSKDKEDAALKALETELPGEWAQYAAKTILLQKTLEYVKTLPVKHTANVLKESDEHKGYFEISNMVYKLTYHTYERTEYSRKLERSVPVAWHVTWDLNFNVPREYHQYHYSYGSTSIAGQRDKRYTDKDAAEKYLKGRIAAYANLFTEISPPIPQDKAKLFCINGLLLPGYTVEQPAPTPDDLLQFLDEDDISLPKVKTESPPRQKEKAPPTKRGHAR